MKGPTNFSYLRTHLIISPLITNFKKSQTLCPPILSPKGLYMAIEFGELSLRSPPQPCIQFLSWPFRIPEHGLNPHPPFSIFKF